MIWLDKVAEDKFTGLGEVPTAIAQFSSPSPAYGRPSRREGDFGWECLNTTVLIHYGFAPSTLSMMLSEWLLNSGAYMHWIFAMPVGYLPACCTRTVYSNTYVPLGK